MMNFVKVVNSDASTELETKINEVLEAHKDTNLVDIKVTGATDAGKDTYMAVIIFRK
jgi:hypothetical protein